MARMKRVLIAEDELNLAGYYVKLLRQWDCEIVVVRRGIDEVRRAAAFRPDIALLSVVMPRMCGVESGIKLRKLCPETKIVLVTGSVPPETLEQLDAQGYQFETLPTPFSREEFQAVVFGDSLKVKS